MNEWRTLPLGELCDVTAGGTPSRADPRHFGGGIPWVKIGDMLQDTIASTEETITQAALENSAAKLLPPGTVLISIFATIGRTAILGVRAATNQAIAGVTPRDPARLMPRYLRRYLDSVVTVLERRARGVAQVNINSGILRSLPIALPPVTEQRRITEILDKADALRAKRRAAVAQLDILTRSIFLDMFGDPLTNPKGFPPKQLVEFYVNRAEGTRCGPFGSALKKSELVPDGIPVWNMDNIDSSGRMAMPFRTWIPESKYRQLEAYAVDDGDVIVSRAGTVGKMCVVKTGGVRSVISTNLIRLRFGPKLLPLYFVSLMTHCKGRVGRLRTGEDGAFTHMNTGILDTLTFPYPPLELQRRFAVIVESIERHKSKHVAQLAKLDMFFAALQQSAFRGAL